MQATKSLKPEYTVREGHGITNRWNVYKVTLEEYVSILKAMHAGNCLAFAHSTSTGIVGLL